MKDKYPIYQTKKAQAIWWITKVCLIGLCWSLGILTATAHGNLHEQIAKVSKLIEAAPDSAELYLKRGALYHQHGDFEEALADFLVVKRKNSFLKNADLQLALLLSDFDRPTEALPYADAFLKHDSQHLQGLLTRARIYSQLNRHTAAVTDYQQAIAIAHQPKPDYYLELSKSILQADSSDYAQAADCLQQGQERLGFLITLQGELVQLAMRYQQYGDAVQWIEDILKKIPRKEQWLAKKATVLAKMGKSDEASISYQKALTAINQLPRRHRQTARMKDLKAEIEQEMAEMEQKNK